MLYVIHIGGKKMPLLVLVDTIHTKQIKLLYIDL